MAGTAPRIEATEPTPSMSNAAAGTIDHHNDPTTSTGIPNKKLLMWAFLASDLSLIHI